jgi:hypothetical protein
MTLEDVKKYLNENDGCTYLVVKKMDGIFVTVYKTRNLRIVSDSLCIDEENQPEIFIDCDRIEKTDYGFRDVLFDEGTKYETFIYNIKLNSNLNLGIREIDKSIKDLKEMLTDLQHSRSLLFLEWLDREEREIDWRNVIS